MPSSRQILEGVQARGLISISHIPLGEGRVLPNLLERTGPADISLVGHNAVAAMGTNNHLPAFRTRRWRIRRRVLELLEIVLIGCHIHIVLSVEAFTTRLAGLPATLMTLMRVIGTERVVIVVAPTAITGIRKHHIRVAIIAYPVVTTKRFGYFPGFPTQTTTRLRYRFVCRFCHREHPPLVSLLLSQSVARRLSPSGESFTRGFSHGSLVFYEQINRKRGLLVLSILPHSLRALVGMH
jgi:hypothetical protein